MFFLIYLLYFVKQLKSSFLQKIEYKSSSKRIKQEIVVLSEKVDAGCEPQQYISHETTFDVTSLPPTDDSSNVCKVRYYIRVGLHLIFFLPFFRSIVLM